MTHEAFAHSSGAHTGSRAEPEQLLGGDFGPDGSGMQRGPARRFASLLAFAILTINAGLTANGQLALREASQNKPEPGSFSVEVQDAQGSPVAVVDMRAAKSKPPAAEFTFDRQYQPGDRIAFTGAGWMAVRMDDTQPECMIYVPTVSSSKLTYEIPYGRAEKETGSAYEPESFAGPSHRVQLRGLKKREISRYRNLALNPCDLPRNEQQAVQFFPHASSNSVSRSLFDFEARNAIDGVSQNGHHGVWPYQSWGPQLRTDIWWKLDFGRMVQLNKIRLMVRADFPHDSYWKSATIEFSDGSSVPLQIAKSDAFQEFPFPRRRISWLRIANVVPEDPSKWCSFIEVQAWGKDLPAEAAASIRSE